MNFALNDSGLARGRDSRDRGFSFGKAECFSAETVGDIFWDSQVATSAVAARTKRVDGVPDQIIMQIQG